MKHVRRFICRQLSSVIACCGRYFSRLWVWIKKHMLICFLYESYMRRLIPLCSTSWINTKTATSYMVCLAWYKNQELGNCLPARWNFSSVSVSYDTLQPLWMSVLNLSLTFVEKLVPLLIPTPVDLTQWSAVISSHQRFAP